MNAYLMTTGALFGLLTLVHIWRVVEEGTHLLSDPFYIAITLVAAVMCVWALQLLRVSGRSNRIDSVSS